MQQNLKVSVALWMPGGGLCMVRIITNFRGNVYVIVVSFAPAGAELQ